MARLCRVWIRHVRACDWRGFHRSEKKRSASWTSLSVLRSPQRFSREVSKRISSGPSLKKENPLLALHPHVGKRVQDQRELHPLGIPLPPEPDLVKELKLSWKSVKLLPIFCQRLRATGRFLSVRQEQRVGPSSQWLSRFRRMTSSPSVQSIAI